MYLSFEDRDELLIFLFMCVLELLRLSDCREESERVIREALTTLVEDFIYL